MSTSFELPLIPTNSPIVETNQPNPGRLQNFADSCKQALGRTAAALGLAVGMVAGETIALDPPAAVAEDGGYPDAGAALYSLASYTWWQDKNGNGRFNTGEDISPRGYGYRNCTDWVAFRTPQLVQMGTPKGWGNAKAWDEKARGAGYTVDATPEPGDIAVWNSGDFGHVEAVESVNADGTVNTSGYNKQGIGLYALRSHVAADAYIDLNGTGKGIDGLGVGAGVPGTPSGDYNHDGFSDPYVIASNSTGSGRVETHILNGTNFQGFLANLATGAAMAPTANVAYLLNDYNKDNNQDLYIIGHEATSTGKIEVHVLAGPNFQSSLGDWVTPAATRSVNQAHFALGDYNKDGYADLYEIALNNTGSGKTEVHIVNGTNFQSFIGHWATVADTVPGDQVKTLLSDYNHDGLPDVYQIGINNTGSGRQEVHILGGTNFGSWIGHWTTPVGMASPEAIQTTLGDYNHDGYADLYNVYPNGSSGKLEVHIVNGTNFQQFLGHWVTAAPGTPHSWVEVANG